MTLLTDRHGTQDNVLARSRCFDTTHLPMSYFPLVDTFEGVANDPQSLHKYLYCHADPVTLADPTGQSATWNQWFGYEVEDEIEKDYKRAFPGNNVTYGKWSRVHGDNGLFRAKPDILDHDRKTYLEIKPLSPSGIIAAGAQMALRHGQFASQGYRPDQIWRMVPSVIYPWGIPTVYFNVAGVLFYTDAVEVAVDYVAIKAISGLWTLVNSGRLAYTVEVALGRCFGLANTSRAIDELRLETHLNIASLFGLAFGIL